MTPKSHIPLIEFQRNALRTSLKDQTPAGLEKYSALQLHDLVKARFPNEPAYLEDAWEAAEVATDRCFIAHTDFRRHPIEKNRKYAEELPAWQPLIDSGSFPCAAEIRAGISSDYPPLIVNERKKEKFYVLDGQRRIITLLYHGVLRVRVHLYTGALRI